MSDQAGAAPSVLWKAFDALGAFSHRDRVLSLAEITRRGGLPKSTAHRVLAMLLETGAVEQADGGYRLGLRMFSLGALPPEAELREAAMVHLEGLHRVTGQTLHLAVLRDGDVVYLEKLLSRQRIDTPAAIGDRLPGTCTAVGKALLALSGEQAQAAVLARPLPRRTTRSVASADALRGQFAAIRARGYATDRGIHRRPRMRCRSRDRGRSHGGGDIRRLPRRGGDRRGVRWAAAAGRRRDRILPCRQARRRP